MSQPSVAITDRLREIPVHLETLELAMRQFGDDFDRDGFIVAAQTDSSEAMMKIYAVERGFEVLQNYLAELAVFGVEALKLRPKRPRPGPKRDFQLLQKQQLISARSSKQLQQLQDIRNQLTHEYVRIQPDELYTAVTELVVEVPVFIRSYEKIMRKLEDTSAAHRA